MFIGPASSDSELAVAIDAHLSSDVKSRKRARSPGRSSSRKPTVSQGEKQHYVYSNKCYMIEIPEY